MRKAAISIMPACLVVALGGLSVTPSVAQVAEPPPDSSFQKVTLEDSPRLRKGSGLESCTFPVPRLIAEGIQPVPWPQQ